MTNVVAPIECPKCGRPCKNGTGLASHLRSCGGPARESGGVWFGFTSRYGVRNAAGKRVGAVDTGGEPCIGLPDGTVIPARAA